ncbi:MAG: phytanoyl-CoA dioxygenase family protein, partial [Bryobacteraceae bacterium]
MVTAETTSGAAVKHFNDYGYVILEDLFSEEEIAPVSDEVDRLLDGRATYIPEKDLIWEPNSNPPRLRNAFRLHLQSDFFLDVAKHPPLLSVVGEILGHPLQLYGSQVFAKPAAVGTAVPIHQDMPYWPFEPYDMLSAWIALDDSKIENGCVRMVAGSHKLGILPHATTSVPGNSLGL